MPNHSLYYHRPLFRSEDFRDLTTNILGEWAERKFGNVVSVKDYPYNAVGDGTHDDTTAIQNALNDAMSIANYNRGNSINGSVCVFFPQGTYRISSTLTFTGNSSLVTYLRGEGAGHGPSGSSIVWYGSAGGVMFEFENFNYGLVEDLWFDGLHSAGKVFWHHANQTSGGATASIFSRCGFVGARDSDGINFAIGKPFDINTRQVDHVKLYDCQFGGGRYCIKTLEGGNTKDIIVLGGNMIGSDPGGVTDGIDWTNASGYLEVGRLGCGALRDMIVAGPSQVFAYCVQVEGCRRFISGGSQGDNLGQATLFSCQMISNAGTVDGVSDPYMIDYAGHLKMEQCALEATGRTGSSNESAVRMNAPNNAAQSFISWQNNYAGTAVSGFAPVYDVSNNRILGNVTSTANPQANRYKIFSMFDSASDTLQGVNLRDLKPAFGGGGIAFDWTSPAQIPAACTINAHGEIRNGWNSITIPRSVWTAAATSQTYTVCELRAKTRIRSVILDVTQAFTGTGITDADIECGYDGDTDGYIVSSDCDGATATFGLVDGDKGVALARASAVDGGHIPSWTSSDHLTVTLRTSGANVVKISDTGGTGVVIVKFFVERLD